MSNWVQNLRKIPREFRRCCRLGNIIEFLGSRVSNDWYLQDFYMINSVINKILNCSLILTRVT